MSRGNDEDLSFDGPVTAKPARTYVDEAADAVPTCDLRDDVPPAASYKDWKDEDTRVVTYAIGTTRYKGIPVASGDEARAHCELVHGPIIEANYVPERAFFRVRRVK